MVRLCFVLQATVIASLYKWTRSITQYPGGFYRSLFSVQIPSYLFRFVLTNKWPDSFLTHACSNWLQHISSVNCIQRIECLMSLISLTPWNITDSSLSILHSLSSPLSAPSSSSSSSSSSSLTYSHSEQ